MRLFFFYLNSTLYYGINSKLNAFKLNNNTMQLFKESENILWLFIAPIREILDLHDAQMCWTYQSMPVMIKLKDNIMKFQTCSKLSQSLAILWSSHMMSIFTFRFTVDSIISYVRRFGKSVELTQTEYIKINMVSKSTFLYEYDAPCFFF